MPYTPIRRKTRHNDQEEPMTRPDIFAMRVSPEEPSLIALLAAREERTPSDVVRRLVRQAAQQHERAPRLQTESAPAGVSIPSQ
jgi:hypothetical protein